ncbi:MAG: hypothetical protein E7320_09385 [Clostridiales bacterium]|nr:hypothetical protein [Clostridiales bacterium]
MGRPCRCWCCAREGGTRQEGRIARIAYALPEHASVPEGKPFRPALTADGQTVQVLVLRP